MYEIKEAMINNGTEKEGAFLSGTPIKKELKITNL